MSESFFTGHALTDADTLWDSEDEDDVDYLSPELTPDFVDFLSIDTQGPELDDDTIDLLSRYGVVNVATFVTFSQFSFSTILSFLTNTELRGLPKRGLTKLRTYGSYLLANDLINPARLIHLEGFQPERYNLYRRVQRRQFSSDFRTALQAEMDQRSRLRVGSARTPTTKGGISGFSDSRGAEEISQGVKRPDAVITPRTTQGTAIPNTDNIRHASATHLTRQLEYPDDKLRDASGILCMDEDSGTTEQFPQPFTL